MKNGMQTVAVAATLVLAGSAMADFYDGAGFEIPDSDPAGFSSTIVVGDGFTVTDVNVTLNDLSHTWVGDLIVSLEAPDGSMVDLMHRTGDTSGGFGDSSDLGGTYTFDDSATGDWWATAGALGGGDVMPSGAYFATGINGAVTSLGSLAGGSAAGNWTLHISDNAAGDTGALGSWTLELVPAPGAFALLGLAGLAGRRRRTA